MMIQLFDYLGFHFLTICSNIGSFVLFFITAIKTLCTTRLKFHQLILQMEYIGVGSFTIIFLTGAFTGLAIALQSYIGFSRIGAEDFIGLVVTFGMTRELGPVLTGIMVTARCGSSMAAEIGTMKISEQIDALTTLRIDPFQYLIVPRILASTIILPFIALFAMMCGIIAGYLYCVYVVGLNPEAYVQAIRRSAELTDITGGLIKSAFFGLILSWTATYQGFHTRGGARGVGRATTRSVVIGSILILIANYFLSSFLFQTGMA
jgi:phospholipid/cholesterol/gamma-HCH transport system permease protein